MGDDAGTGALEWGKVGGRNSETTRGVQSVRVCNQSERHSISCSSYWSVNPL